MEDDTFYDESYFEHDKPVHRPSYCAFLDVLGFSERIKASYAAGGSGNELLQRFHAVLSPTIAKLKNETLPDSAMYFKSFTDNIVLAHPRISPDMESEFAFTMWAIRDFQLGMALQGFFVRGGMATGLLFIDDNSAYGEALLEAYRLESKVAVNPIVVLCDRTMGLVDAHCKFYHGEDPPQKNAVLKGADGRYFLNYLAVAAEDLELLNTDILEQHKARIEEALLEHAAKPNVFAKFAWLAAYHDYYCESVSHMPGYSSALKVGHVKSAVKIGTI